jgi:hypothetical protein
MKKIRLIRTVKQEMYFCEDDFGGIEEFNEFVLELKSDKDFREDTFYDNLDDDCDGESSDISLIEEVEN